MARRARESSGTGIYHVMLRGINRQDIFEDDEDYRAFIEILSKLDARKSDDGVSTIRTSEVFAYCLMPNHVHLLLMEKEWALADIVKLIASCYVFYYNKKYGRVGHLFQDRFKSEPCNDAAYFLILIRYIHQNPVKAGLAVRAEDYEYSSWRNDYLGMSPQRICHIRPVVNRYGLEDLKEMVNMPLPEKYGCVEMESRVIVSDDNVRCLLLSLSGTRSITEFQLLEMSIQKDLIVEAMHQLHAGPRQMSRVSGMSYSVIQRLTK